MTAPGTRDVALAPGRRKVHPDRVGLPSWLLLDLFVVTGLAVGSAGWSAASARGLEGAVFGIGLGTLATGLALVFLPSVSIKFVARAMALVSGVILSRFGVLGGPEGTELIAVVLWVFAVVGVVVLTDQVGDGTQPLNADAPGPGPPPPEVYSAATTVHQNGAGPNALDSRAREARSLSRVVAIGASLLLLVALALPYVADHLRKPSDSGDPARLPDPTAEALPLRASNTLDMTQRPRPSNRVVFRVDSPRRTFWRGQSFDLWDGRFWARSDSAIEELGPAGRVPARQNDLAAEGNDIFTQRFEMVSPYADLLYGAATPISVDAPAEIYARGDGALLTATPIGAGTSYTVTSRRVLTTPADLRAADEADVPDEVLAQYAEPPVTTDRVRAAATRITADADTTFDRIMAIQGWMGEQTEYSLDAPLAPTGADVVDDFLFESRQGWCEQIASSLVVLARANGIPARLVTGFVPGDQDRLTGEFIVRERNAHAWAEVWFAGVGWVPFDPTADVPLAGADNTDRTWGEWLARHSLTMLLVALGMVVFVVIVVFIGRRLAARRRRRDEQLDDRPTKWAGLLDARLDTLGARAGRQRAPAETATAYATSVGEHIGAPDIGDVGRTIDASLYAPRAPTPAEQSAAEAILERHESDDLVPS